MFQITAHGKDIHPKNKQRIRSSISGMLNPSEYDDVGEDENDMNIGAPEMTMLIGARIINHRREHVCTNSTPAAG